MSKQSSYSKMKAKMQAQIDALYKDIYNLVEKDCPETKLKWKVKITTEANIWQGSATENQNSFQGIIAQISKA